MFEYRTRLSLISIETPHRTAEGGFVNPSLVETRIHDLVEVRLRQVDLRYTKGRRTVIEVLHRRGGPVGIAEIESDAPELPRSSAYRHLVDLCAVGAIRSIRANGDFTHFELSEALTEHHHHLHCLICGDITDVTPSDHFEKAIDKMVGQFSDQTGFQSVSHSLEIFGHCSGCSAQPF